MHLGADKPLGALDKRTDLFIENRQRKRLDDIVVAAEGVGLEHIGFVSPRRDEHNRHVALPANLAAYGKAVQLGEHHVEKQHVVVVFIRLFKTSLTVGGNMHLKHALFLKREIVYYQFPDIPVVFHKQKPIHFESPLF